MNETIHQADEDLISYLNYNRDIYELAEVENVLALVPGHNDEDRWYWIIRLSGNRYVYTEAWCDYTGWDCQSGGRSELAHSPFMACGHAPVSEGIRKPKWNLEQQVLGKQPFGLEIIETA